MEHPAPRVLADATVEDGGFQRFDRVGTYIIWLRAETEPFDAAQRRLSEAIGRFVTAVGELEDDEWIDAQSSNGEELCRLDAVIEEHRRRIIERGRPRLT